MVTLGIDLAAEPKSTAGCDIEWSKHRAHVRWVSAGLSDEDILQRASGASVVGIDAPFGWPTYFVEAIAAHHSGKPWPVHEWNRVNRRRLRLRATDERIHEATRITPLSVSCDALAIPATRCALLLDRLGVQDRSGDGRVQEVYPAAALHAWGLRCKGYKGRENGAVLADLFASLRKRAPWLAMAPPHAKLCATSDHIFDALIASLVARAAALGLTLRPTADELPAARIEGWIALPFAESLSGLTG
jgi:predicted nuclease with RNAse H fold